MPVARRLLSPESMRSFRPWVLRLVLLSVASLADPARAHLMVSQHGTLNLVGDGAFLVLSLPVAAFPEADDDGDHRLSVQEFRAHQADLGAAVQAGVQLLDDEGPRPLEGTMLSLTASDEVPGEPAVDLVVLGRFALASEGGRSPAARKGRTPPTPPGAGHPAPAGEPLRPRRHEPLGQVTVTRGPDQQLLVLSPQHPTGVLLPSAWEAFVAALELGLTHLFAGLDHLLFLLVVVAAGGGWRHLLAALTCFTVGHAATLALSIVGGVSAPAALVEPAIAATIVGMALLDWRAHRTGRAVPPATRLALVFGCALIHGLGLASSLVELGLDRRHVLPLVAGFNLGIELGQVAVAGAALGTVWALRRLLGGEGPGWAAHLARAGSVFAGTAWFVQRVLA